MKKSTVTTSDINALQAHGQRADQCLEQLACISKKIARRANSAAFKPDDINWGHAGDLAHVAELLGAIDNFLGKGIKA